jgi:tRNA-binding protein
MITIRDFEKLELRTGRVKAAERIPDTKLVKLKVDIGTEVRQMVAGGGLEPEDLLGKNVVVLANLEPKELRGIQSNGMILAADVGSGKKPIILTPVSDVPPGTKVR